MCPCSLGSTLIGSLMNYLDAPNVVSKETLRAVSALGPTAVKVLERWVGGWPKATKELEKAGKLIESVKDQANREAEIYGEARRGGQNSHLADHEIAELYDLAPGPPAP